MNEPAANTKIVLSKSSLTKITHDLKTPVNNIIGFANLLETLIADYNNPALTRYLEIIQKEAEQANMLINSLSGFCRQEDESIGSDNENSILRTFDNFNSNYRNHSVKV
jgi:signal transduction histidine kinase